MALTSTPTPPADIVSISSGSSGSSATLATLVCSSSTPSNTGAALATSVVELVRLSDGLNSEKRVTGAARLSLGSGDGGPRSSTPPAASRAPAWRRYR